MELRVRSETKQRIEHAAGLVDQPVSEFVRSAVEDRVEEVLAQHDLVTVVSADFFDALLAALDEPTVRNEALARGSRLASEIVSR